MSDRGANTATALISTCPNSATSPPDLRLVYNSSDTGRGGAENFVAFGWRLAGLSRIERESVGGGVPMFDDGQDIYRLDDMELMACSDSAATNKWTKKYPLRYLTTVSSASCSACGSMSTRVESYNRIVYDDLANEFRVTRPDGRRYIYRSVGDIAGDPNTSGNDWLVGKKSRWVLVEITDTQKDAAGNYTNAVSIGWAMGPATDGFAERPVSISYAGYRVGLNYVQPAQPVARFGTGGTQLGTQRYRLSSVTITDGVQNVRAYNLVTGPSAQTATALLTKIESYGSDYAVTSGVVTAGTKLPDVSFEYSADQYAFDTRAYAGVEFHGSNDFREIGFTGRDFVAFRQYDSYYIKHINNSDGGYDQSV